MEKDQSVLYEIEVCGKAKVEDVENDYLIKIETEVTPLEIGREYSIYRFSEKRYDLERYQDPLIVQVIEVSNLVANIYETIDIKVNQYGRIKDIVNKKEVRQKWEKVKQDLLKKYPLASYEVIRAKEFELSNPKLEYQNLQFMHLLHIYFFLYGRENATGTFTATEMDRFGLGIAMPTQIKYATKKEENTFIKKFEGKVPSTAIEVKNRLKKSAKVTDPSVLPSYTMVGNYVYKDAILEKGEFVLEQTIGNNYYNKNELKIKTQN